MAKINDNIIIYDTKMAHYEYDTINKSLEIGNINVNKFNYIKLINDINSQLSSEVKKVIIKNIKNLNILNTILLMSSDINSNNVVIDVTNNIEHLYKDSDVNIRMLDRVKGVKIKISDGKQIIDNNFTTWAHNSDENDKFRIVNVLTKKDKTIFMEEEKLINEIYHNVMMLYSDFLNLSKEEQFNAIFEYIGSNYIYDINILNLEDRYKLYSIRSRLLKLATNNSLLNIDCYTVQGSLRGRNDTYTWNEVIFDNEVYFYDISYDMKKKKDIEHLGRRIVQRDTKIKDLLNNEKIKPIIVKDEKIYDLRPLPFENI